MAITTTVYADTVTYNTLTWNKGTGGPLRVDLTYAGSPIQDRTGNANFATFVQVVDTTVGATVYLRDISLLKSDKLKVNEKSSLVLTATAKGGASVQITLSNMVFVSGGVGQGRAEPGSYTMHLVHESDDGSTHPIS